MTHLVLLTNVFAEEIDVQPQSRKLALLLTHYNALRGCADLTRLPLGIRAVILHDNSTSCETPFQHPPVSYIG